MKAIRCYLLCFAMACAPLGSVAAQPGAGAASAPDEVRLEISAIGVIHSAPDLIVILIPVSARAPTSAEARAKLETQVTKVTTALAAKGVRSADISIRAGAAGAFGFVGNEAYDESDETGWTVYPPNGSAQNEAAARTSIMQVKLHSQAELSLVRELLDAENLGSIASSSLQLADDHGARKAAVGRAVDQARSDADAYAAAIGMRVSRIIRMSNQPSPNGAPNRGFAAFISNPWDLHEDVTTTARVTVEFALVPR